MPWEVAMVMMLGLIVKHTIADFWIQGRFPWMWMNKGKFMHPGGIVHSLTHVVGTLIILWPFVVYLEESQGHLFRWRNFLWGTLTFEFVVHYLTDYLKMNINRWRGWKCNTSPYFWDLLGLDQLIHLLTYWIIVVAWITVATTV